MIAAEMIYMNESLKNYFSGKWLALVVLSIATLAGLVLIMAPTHQAAAMDTVSSAVYQDLNHDGQVDNVQVTFDENVTACAYEAGDWGVTVAGGINVTAITGISGTCNGTDAILNIAVTAAAGFTGGAVAPTVTYADQGTTGSVTLVSGALSAKTISPTDGAAPVVLSVAYLDTDLDSRVDTIQFNTSREGSINCGVFTGGASFTVGTAGTINLVPSGADTCATNGINDFQVILGTRGALGISGGVVSPIVTYTQSGSGVADGAGNFLPTAAGLTVADATPPFIRSVSYLDTNYDGQVDHVQFNTSTDTGIACNTFVGNTTFTVGTAGTVALASSAGDTCSSNGTSNFTIALATLGAANMTGGAVAPVVTYTQAGTGVADAAGNHTPTMAGITVADAAAPIIISTSPASGATGVQLTAPIVVNFSETMLPASCAFSAPAATATYGDITSGANWSVGTSGQTASQATLAVTGNNSSNVAIQATVSGCTDAGALLMAAGTVAPNPWTFTTRAQGSSGGNGGGSNVVVNPSIVLNIPYGGATYTPGQMVGVDWTARDGAYTGYRVSFSPDSGATWSVLATVSGSNSGYTWTVPDISTIAGIIKVEGLNSSGTVLASATSASSFSINGKAVTPPVTPPTPAGEQPAPAQADPTATGIYDPSAALEATASIDVDNGIAAAAPGTAVYCDDGSLVKGSTPAVYYCGADGKRYVFTTARVYFTWYNDFSGVRTISDDTLALIPIGGNVTYRPGKKLVKAQTDPKVYAISRGGLLRWVPSEAVAAAIYGKNWQHMVDYVPDAFFFNYTIGTPLAQ